MSMPTLQARILVVALLCLATASACEPVVGVSVGIDRIGPRDVHQAEPRPVVLDVRAPEDFAAGHIPGAVRLSFDELDGYLVHQSEREQPVATVCYSGYQSLLAATIVRANGRDNVKSISGGMKAWSAAGLPTEQGAGDRPEAESLLPPMLRLSTFEQAIIFLSGMVIKPLYMLLSLVIAIGVWRSRVKSVVLLRWGLLTFFVGEAFCAIAWATESYGASYAIDLLHGAGMVAMGALVSWGLFQMLDDRVLRFVEPGERCTIQRFCGHCWKREPVSCGAHRLFVFAAPALALVALMPLSGPILPRHYQTNVFGSVVDYGLPVLNQIVEFRIYPLIATALLLWTVLRLRGGPASVRRAQLPLFVGMGFMGFSTFRFLLVYSYSRVLHWSDFWEELTELLAVLAVGLTLWFFREQLGLAKRKRPDQRETEA